jgi:hypothetical protein
MGGGRKERSEDEGSRVGLGLEWVMVSVAIVGFEIRLE